MLWKLHLFFKRKMYNLRRPCRGVVVDGDVLRYMPTLADTWNWGTHVRFWGAGGGAVWCRQHKYSSSEGFTAQGCVLRLQNCTTNAKFLLQLVLLELVFLWRGLHGGADFGPENENVDPQKLMSCSLHLLEQSSMSMSCPSVANISRMASSWSSTMFSHWNW